MRHPRDWSNRAWWLAGALGLVALVVANQINVGSPSRTFQDQLVRFAPVAAGIVALGSLLVTAVSAAALHRRQRRQATIEAWIAWSDSTADGRRCVSDYLPARITLDHARGLVGDGPLVDKNDNVVSEDQRQKLLESLVTLLNGLERIANGTRVGVYDADTLRRLGGTIIVTTYLRFESYVEYRRTTANRDHRQTRAFLALEKQVAELKRHELDRERLGRAAGGK